MANLRFINCNLNNLSKGHVKAKAFLINSDTSVYNYDIMTVLKKPIWYMSMGYREQIGDMLIMKFQGPTNLNYVDSANNYFEIGFYDKEAIFRIKNDNMMYYHQNEITFSNMPNYGGRISFSHNTTYTAVQNGYVINYTTIQRTHVLKTIINGLAFYSSSYDPNNYISDVHCFPIAKGQTYRTEETSSGRFFIPTNGGF